MGKKAKGKKFFEKNSLNNKISFIDKLILIGLFFGLFFIPILVKVHYSNFISPTISDYFAISSGVKGEMFSHLKFIILIVLTFIISLLFLYKVFILNYQIKATKINIITTFFMIIVVISSVFSTYKYIALFGYYERSEGAITFLCYSIMFFIASNISIKHENLKWFLYGISPFIIINGVIGLLNFYGVNLLEISVVNRLIAENFGEKASFTDGSILMGTLDQGNYLSGASSLLVCFTFIQAILTKNMKLKIFNIILLFLSFGMLFASLSNSGFITISMLLPLFLILLLLKKMYREFGFSLILMLLSFLVIFLPMQNHNKIVLDETFGNIPSLIINSSQEGGGQVNSSKEKINDAGNFTSPEKIDTDFLPQLPDPSISWGNGRSYIWSTFISLIMERPVLGYGFDTYAFHFPINDIKMMNGLGTGNAVVDKPHSLYLDIAFGTGVIGLLIFLIMVSIPLIKSIKKILLCKEIKGNSEIIVITFLLLAYLIQGIVNDSNIGTSVIFFILLGILNTLVTNYETKL